MRSTTLWPRLAAACGLLYPVLLVVGDDVIAQGDQIASDAGTPEELLTRLAAKDTPAFFLGRSIGLISLLCLLIFAGYVAAQLRRHRGAGSMLPYLALAGGTAAATLQMSSAAAQFALVRSRGAGLDPALVKPLLDLGAGFLIAMLPFAALVAAVAIEGVHGRMVARGIGWTGAVLAVALIVGFVLAMTGTPFGFVALPLSWLWFVAAGISLVRRAGEEPAGRPARQRATVG
jgi:hypothetical protein